MNESNFIAFNIIQPFKRLHYALIRVSNKN